MIRDGLQYRGVFGSYHLKRLHKIWLDMWDGHLPEVLDLSGANLTGHRFFYSLAGADLRGAILHRTGSSSIEGADLTGAEMFGSAIMNPNGAVSCSRTVF